MCTKSRFLVPNRHGPLFRFRSLANGLMTPRIAVDIENLVGSYKDINITVDLVFDSIARYSRLTKRPSSNKLR